MANNTFGQDKTLWIFAWLAFAVWICAVAFTQLNGWLDHYFFQNIDYDPVLRILRALEFVQSGDWMNDVFRRIDPPSGMVLPWAHPLDLLLAAGGWLLHFFMPLRDALLVWGMLLSPLLWAGFAIALQWAARPLLKNDLERMILLFLTGAAPAIFSTFYLLRAADHHALALIFQALTIGALLRSQGKLSWTFWAGILCAAGFWTAIEGFMLFILVASGLGLLWLMSGSADILKRLICFTCGMLVLCIPALLVEKFSDIFLVEHDRISIVHIVWVSSTLFAAWLLQRGANNIRYGYTRWLAGGMAALFVFAVMQYSFPGFFHGPNQQVDPWLQRVWLANITEMKPLESWQWWSVLPWCLMGYLGIEHALKSQKLNGENYRLHLWFAIFAGYFLAGIFSPRWLRNIEIMELPFVALALAAASEGTVRRFLSAQPIWWRPVAQILVIGCALYGLVMTPFIFTAPIERQMAIKNAEMCQSGVSLLAQYGDWDRMLGSKPITIVMSENISPVIVFWTVHDGLVSNYHRNLAGFHKLAQLVAAPDERAARAVMKKYNLGAILLCGSDIPSQPSPHDAINLEKADWLNSAHPPAWLVRLPWPTDNEKLNTVPLNARPILLRVKN